jgi:hypothetical protein
MLEPFFMTSLLLIQAALIFIALRRGWRVAPFAIMAVPHLIAKYAPLHLPELALAGWALPMTYVVFGVGAASTVALLYTAVANPEPA